MAHKKGVGSTRLGRDSRPQYLGTKVGDGEQVSSGAVLVRQRGTPIHPGKNVCKGRDDTLYASVRGIVKFQKKKRVRFDGALQKSTFVHVMPAQ